MSGREVVEVRNPADTVGLVLSKRSDTMRRQARKRYLQVVERNGGPGRDRTDDLFHAIELTSSNFNSLRGTDGHAKSLKGTHRNIYCALIVP